MIYEGTGLTVRGTVFFRDGKSLKPLPPDSSEVVIAGGFRLALLHEFDHVSLDDGDAPLVIHSNIEGDDRGPFPLL
jgi:hypothetical protein